MEQVEPVDNVMRTQPDWLIEKTMTLQDGSTALWSYDTEGDVLEIIFGGGAAPATVELAPGVFLRFDPAAGQALSLGIVSATPLLQPGEFGPYLLRLDGLTGLPLSLREVVLTILTSPPVSEVLRVFSYLPTPEAETPVPLAGLRPAA